MLSSSLNKVQLGDQFGRLVILVVPLIVQMISNPNGSEQTLQNGTAMPDSPFGKHSFPLHLASV